MFLRRQAGRQAEKRPPPPYAIISPNKQLRYRIRLPTTQWPFDHCAVATELVADETPDLKEETKETLEGAEEVKKFTKAWKTASLAALLASLFVVFLPMAVDLHNYCRDKDFVNSYGVLLIFSS